MNDIIKEKTIRYRNTKDGKFAPILDKTPERVKDWYKNLPGKNQTAKLEIEEK